MAKRNRYREMESMMTKIILGDVVMFAAYLVFAALGLGVWKVITAIIAICCSALGFGWLVLTGEMGRRRSLWMVTIFACILICVVLSLLLQYPAPIPTA